MQLEFLGRAFAKFVCFEGNQAKMMVNNMMVYQYSGQTVAFWIWIHRKK